MIGIYEAIKNQLISMIENDASELWKLIGVSLIVNLENNNKDHASSLLKTKILLEIK